MEDRIEELKAAAAEYRKYQAARKRLHDVIRAAAQEGVPQVEIIRAITDPETLRPAVGREWIRQLQLRKETKEPQ